MSVNLRGCLHSSRPRHWSLLALSSGHRGTDPAKHLERCLVWHWKSQWVQLLQLLTCLRTLWGYVLLFALICFLFWPCSWPFMKPEIFSLVSPSILSSARKCKWYKKITQETGSPWRYYYFMLLWKSLRLTAICHTPSSLQLTSQNAVENSNGILNTAE